MWQRGAWLALPILVVLGLAFASHSSAPVAQLLPAPDQRPCIPSPFTPLDDRQTGALVAAGEGWTFATEAWLRGRVCSPGVLSITGQGILGGEELPRLTVAQQGGTVSSPEFGASLNTVQVRIPRAGQVFLAFANDLYQADARIATVFNFSLTTTSCGSLSPAPRSVPWTPGTPAVSLVDAAALILNPCAGGVFTMQAVGREGGGAFPEVAVTQAGRTLLQVTTRADVQNFRVVIGAGPLSIAMTNPYFRTLANRDLTIRKLTFTSD